MRKIPAAAICIACVLSLQGSSASTPIHFIYLRTGATEAQFQSDRDLCHHNAVKTRWYTFGHARWSFSETPSSTVFLNCMAEKGYTLSKDGWDTGVLWVLPYHPSNWHGAGWHVVEPAGYITSGPYDTKDACLAAKPSNSQSLNCVWLDRDPDSR